MNIETEPVELASIFELPPPREKNQICRRKLPSGRECRKEFTPGTTCPCAILAIVQGARA